MHIPDGFLAPEVAAVCAVPAVSAVGYGLRRASRELDERRVPLLGVTAAFVFAVQMLNFPVAGGTSGHFLGAALAAILLGPWMACLVMSVVLVTQSFVFADGGVTALGANVLNMGVIGALLVGGLIVLAQRVLGRVGMVSRGVFLAVAGVGAWLAVVAGALACSVELAVSGTVPLGTVLPAMLGVHVLIGIGEAVITVAAVSAVLSTRPDVVKVIA
jgi:cobalt/nickel transport system permease protein